MTGFKLDGRGRQFGEVCAATKLGTCQALVTTRGYGVGDRAGNRCCTPAVKAHPRGPHLCWVHAAALDNPNRAKPLDLHKSAIGVE